jgi:predicted O-methyltransferase YrrM
MGSASPAPEVETTADSYTLKVPYRTPDGPPPERYGPNANVSLFAWPGDFGSPVVDPRRLRGIGSDDPTMVDLPGIELSVEHHQAVWRQWLPHIERWEADAAAGRRYHAGAGNDMFGATSGRWLAGAIGSIRPKRYVEIGSGFSSALILDINDEQRPDDPIHCTFIDPKPDRLLGLLRAGDEEHCDFLKCPVQEVDLSVFDRLESDDVLFIDSSHVAKSESDVVTELFTILPRLKSGVYIHFHDIPYPFDYPRRWLVEQNRSWNEAYFLRAFLMHNTSYPVHFWTDYFALFCGPEGERTGLAAAMTQRASSIWLRKR